MKKLFFILLAFVLIAGCNKSLLLDDEEDLMLKKGKVGCTTIQSGELKTSTGDVITPGFMANGYNYQAHMYSGEYAPGWKLVMKWNDAWLSNQDCDGDGKLDRPMKNGAQYYFGSGAWCTNHWMTTYVNENGEQCSYEEFTKIVAVPEGSTLSNGYWYKDGVEIGQNIWGQFAIVQSIVNDPCAGVEGVQYKSPDHPGLGNW
jgi:hypothetical protein